MELTTGAILRRITETPLSTGAHKLATIILDGIAWKDGYNGLERGTAAFTLAHLAEKMGVSRQHLTTLLVELAASSLALVRWKPNGKFAPWLFRFGGSEEVDASPYVVSASGDISLSRKSKNKTIFAGRIEIADGTNVYRTPWADLIKAAKASLACWNVDTQVIWDRFLAFNRSRGNAVVPAGFLLGFMRRWRSSLSLGATTPAAEPVPRRSVDPKEMELHDLIRAAPSSNREFYASDLRRLIGQVAYTLVFSTSSDSSDVPSLPQYSQFMDGLFWLVRLYVDARNCELRFQMGRTICCLSNWYGAQTTNPIATRPAERFMKPIARRHDGP